MVLVVKAFEATSLLQPRGLSGRERAAHRLQCRRRVLGPSDLFVAWFSGRLAVDFTTWHGSGIFTNIHHTNDPYVGKYSSTMEHMGHGSWAWRLASS